MSARVAPVPISRAAYIAHRIAWRTRERLAISRQWFHRAPLDLVGSYYTSNIGDRSMGLILAQIARAMGISTNLRSYHFDRYPAAQSLLMGGGELGDATHFSLLRSASPNPDNVGVHGINPSVGLEQAPEALLHWLRGVRTLTVRSRWGAKLMSRILDRDVQYAPDLAFAIMPTLLAPEQLETPRERVLGMNITPFYMTVKRQCELHPDLTTLPYFEQYVPRFAKALPGAGSIYLNTMRTIARTYVQRGWNVVSVPMTGVDDLFARTLLAGTGAKALRFHPSPVVSLQRIARCERFIACRFHSHVFAMAAGVPSNSLAVAAKAATLWSESGLDPDAQVDRLALVEDPEASTEKLLDGTLALTLSPTARADLRESAHLAAQASVRAMRSQDTG